MSVKPWARVQMLINLRSATHTEKCELRIDFFDFENWIENFAFDFFHHITKRHLSQWHNFDVRLDKTGHSWECWQCGGCTFNESFMLITRCNFGGDLGAHYRARTSQQAVTWQPAHDFDTRQCDSAYIWHCKSTEVWWHGSEMGR